LSLLGSGEEEKVAGSPVYKTLYRAVVWSTFLGLVWTLALVVDKSPPLDVEADPVAAARAAEKLAAADEAEAAGESGQRVTLNGKELNSYLAQNLELERSPASEPSPEAPNRTAPAARRSSDPVAGLDADGAVPGQMGSIVKDARIQTDGDLVKAYVLFDFHGKDLSLELEGHLGSEDGYLKFDPVAGKLGHMPLPLSLLQASVDKLMASPENRDKLRLPEDISDIQIVNGQLVVSYK
jgi:hypothetical protein